MERFIEVAPDGEGTRIDKYISDCLDDMSRNYIQKLIREGQVLIGGEPVKVNARVRAGEIICIPEPETEEADIYPEDIPLDILYEDDDILIVNKPKGMVVHPAPGHDGGTLVNAVMFHCRDQLSGINGVLRPGIVHRIDKDTTGSIIVCKNDDAHRNIAEQLKAHTITRRYRALVFGRIEEDEGTVDAPIGRHPIDRKKMAVNDKTGKNAVTHYRVLERFDRYTYIECQLETGRTHQIRVHMTSIGHPLVGDGVYTNAKTTAKLQGQTLHAMTIGFLHPRTGTYVEFEAPLPDYFEELLEKLRNGVKNL